MTNNSDVFHIDLPDVPSMEEGKSDSEESNHNSNAPEVGIIIVFVIYMFRNSCLEVRFQLKSKLHKYVILISFSTTCFNFCHIVKLQFF